ncbi:Hypothetical protein A7982_11802 [Minicystis rosea]|nr:Hypothetical protein A7982_11802 [Minicystis rosea]
MASSSIVPAPRRRGRAPRERGEARSRSILPTTAPDRSNEPTAEEALLEVQRLFDAGPDSGLTVRVYGGSPTGDAFRELLDSLRMYDDRYREGRDVLVHAPSRASLSRALATLGGGEQRRRAIGHALETFGPRLVHPLGEVIEDSPGALPARLSMMRDIVLAQIASLRLTPESQRLLSNDMRRLLSDEYLGLLAENEEHIERPRVRALAREILRLLGATFQRALVGLPAAADGIAGEIEPRLSGDHPLREMPARVRREITAAVEGYLREATSAELEASLTALFAEHGVSPTPLPRDGYREVAERCWEIVASCC